MYYPTSDACAMQSGETPLSAAFLAASQAVNDQADLAVVNANGNWQGLIQRTWPSFQGLGPYVALQLRNASPVGGSLPTGQLGPDGLPLSGSGITPVGGGPSGNPPIAGIDLIPQGNPDGSNPAAGSAPSVYLIGGIPGRRRVGGGRRGTASNGGPGPGTDAAFVATFGPSPVQTYDGPPPQPGSVLSLVYGGAHDPLATGPGVAASGTPDPRLGYWGAAGCPSDQGVYMLPWGEPDYGGPGGNGAAAGAGGPGSSLWLWALLGLCGVAYLADRHEKKTRGHKT